MDTNNIGIDCVQTDPKYNFKNVVLDNTDINDSTLYHNIGHICKYYEQDEFQDRFHSISKQISFFSQNIRSLPGKWVEFEQFCREVNKEKFRFTVIALQEIWNVPKGTNFDLPGYKPFHFSIRDPTGLNGNAGGGIGLWIDKDFEFDPIKKISIFEPNVFESQFIKIKTSKNKFIIVGNIYRPPHTDLPRFNEILNDILTHIGTDSELQKAEDVQLLSDSNIDLLQYNQHGHTNAYVETLLSNSLLPLITLPTRITDTTATIIDHISTSHKSDTYDTGIIQSSLSDHLPIFYVRHNDTSRPLPKYVKSRKINTETTRVFTELITNTSFATVTEENRPKQAFDNFFNIIEKCVDEAFPDTTIKINTSNAPLNPWMTNGLMKSRKHKEKLFSKKIRNPTELNVKIFKNYNTIYNKIKRTSKRQYYDSKFKEFSSNMRKTWDTIREVTRTKKRKENMPDYFKNNGEIITGAASIAEGFNSFFSSIGPELANNISPSNINFESFLGAQIEEEFIFSYITKDTMNKMVGKLKSKNSSGPDYISTKLLKIILPSIMAPLCHIFNLSLQTGFIPHQLKTAKVVPIYKSGEKNIFTNYRPISLLSSFSKLLEKIVSQQIFGFLYKHKILYKHQYGFRKGHGTSHPIVHFLDKIYTSLNKNKPEYTLGIFLDLKKALTLWITKFY